MTRTASPTTRPGASWSIVCDFDGTVALEDVTDALLARFAGSGWQALEEAWEDGRIGARTCMAGQVGLLDCSAAELLAHVAGIEIDPHFASFVALVLADGASFAIASDGLDRVIHAMLASRGLDHLPVRASRLVHDAERQWSLEFPFAHAACTSRNATCKCAIGAAQPARRTLLVGDGASDFCIAARADLTFAKSRLLAHCAAHRLPHRPIRGFADAIVAWRELVAAPHHHTAREAST